MDRVLEGKVALVTGGSRGLGAKIAETFADQGADIAITYARSADKAEAVVAALKDKGVCAVAIQADQVDPGVAKPLIEQVMGAFGRLDILVNNAGQAQQGTRTDDPEIESGEFDKQWYVNVLGTVAITRAASRQMADGGRIVFIGSGVGERAMAPGMADYGGTKAALVGYANGVQRDLGPRNITVSVVQPGIMLTDMHEQVKKFLPPDILDNIPSHRYAETADVAAAVSYLVSPGASYTGGAVLDVSGGILT